MMSGWKSRYEVAILIAAFLAGWVFVSYAGAADRSKANAENYLIDFADARGFSVFDGNLILLDHTNRTLYSADSNGNMSRVEDMDGWAISDVTIIGRTPVYCSRDRVLWRRGNQVERLTIDGASQLRSITTDGVNAILLDVGLTPQIWTVNLQTRRVVSRIPYPVAKSGLNARPVDIAIKGKRLFALDLADRCVHQIDLRSGKEILAFQAGPGLKSGSGGIAFINNELYVHEADFQRLRPISWKTNPDFVSSWSQPMKMTFVQESRNVSDTEGMLVDFHIPVPPRTPTQVVDDLQWSQPPTQWIDDQFGQRIAKFTDVKINAGRFHELTYSTKVYARAVQYDLPRLPLKTLDRLPAEIKETYLADEPIFQLDSDDLAKAARLARLGVDGKAPKDVQTLVTNIAWYLSRHFKYAMDDSWDDAETCFNRGTGSCSEYSFVFSSLCRLNGIPTRLIGGVLFDDFGKKHRSEKFHRWTEVYFPTVGWVPVDVTKFDDGNDESRDGEFLFGTPGYVITLSQGGIDPVAMGTAYYIRRRYRGGKRERQTYALFEPWSQTQSVTLRLP